jgi:oxygen-independent coproporphyrinogen-3 oxidase
MQSLLLSMSGIYIHIPFCKKACHYCNFHFSTQLERKSELVDSIVQEIHWRKDYLSDRNINTIYLGGGTPSLLNKKELDLIFEALQQSFEIASDAEVTLEANPDDLTIDKLKDLASSPVNRLSIGIQSFYEEDLLYMNRSHNAVQAQECITQAQDLGFDNLSIDLIYGSPTTSDAMWKTNVQKAIDFKITHLSCYALTVEPKTALAHMIEKQKTAAPDESKAADQFRYLIDRTKAAGYQHYEISNLALDGGFSKHNTNYWMGVPYLGIGPAAHSFDQNSRQWNIAHNIKYMKAVQNRDLELLSEKEVLSPIDQTNEYILTSLRTMWGMDLNKVKLEEHRTQIKTTMQKYLDEGLILHNSTYVLSEKAKFLADGIASELFV